MDRIGRFMIALVGVAIIAIGARFLIAPEAGAMGFGVPAPAGDRSYLFTKGVRDIASGLFLLGLLALRERRAAAFVTLVAVLIPLGDCLIVLRAGGPAGVAFGIHGATALFMLIAAVLVWRRA